MHALSNHFSLLLCMALTADQYTTSPPVRRHAAPKHRIPARYITIIVFPFIKGWGVPSELL